MNVRMKNARQAKAMSQADLANLIGVSRQTVNMVESGEYNPTLALCLRICTVLDCTLNDLFWEGSLCSTTNGSTPDADAHSAKH